MSRTMSSQPVAATIALLAVLGAGGGRWSSYPQRSVEWCFDLGHSEAMTYEL